MKLAPNYDMTGSH